MTDYKNFEFGDLADADIIVLNGMIANFLGWEETGPGFPIGYESPNKLYSYEELSYHKDWEWLMPVVEKIESLGYTVKITGRVCFIPNIIPNDYRDERTKMQSIYMAVIDFLYWNQNKTK